MSALMEAPVFNLERAISFFLLQSSFPLLKGRIWICGVLTLESLDGSWQSLSHLSILLFIVEEKMVLFLGSFQFLTLCSCAVAFLQFSFLIFRLNPGAWWKVLVIFILWFGWIYFSPAYLRCRGVRDPCLGIEWLTLPLGFEFWGLK